MEFSGQIRAALSSQTASFMACLLVLASCRLVVPLILHRPLLRPSSSSSSHQWRDCYTIYIMHTSLKKRDLQKHMTGRRPIPCWVGVKPGFPVELGRACSSAIRSIPPLLAVVCMTFTGLPLSPHLTGGRPGFNMKLPWQESTMTNRQV
uniref:Uncharacterized protein n=1 Tax=Salix viminalis TaxID=40686 RepID=A0A6N2KRQ6_SALVM